MEVYTYVDTETLRASVDGSSLARWVDGAHRGFVLGFWSDVGVSEFPGGPLWRAYPVAAEPVSGIGYS